jgi:hypothetical protein
MRIRSKRAKVETKQALAEIATEFINRKSTGESNVETTRALVIELQQALVAQYAVELKALPIAPKTRDLLIDGFRDGAREGIRHAVEMLGGTIKE